jgi:adenylate cyclase
MKIPLWKRFLRTLYLLPIPLFWIAVDQHWISIGQNFFSQLINMSMDWRFQVRGEIPAPVKVFYVDLDSFALSVIGERPWDHAFFADVAEIVLELGNAKAVGFDFIFSPLARSSQLIDEEKSKKSDWAFSKTLQKYPSIVMGINYTSVHLPWMVYPGEVSRYGGFPFKSSPDYNPKTNPYPETPTYPLIGPGWGNLGLIAIDHEEDNGVICRVIPFFSEFEGPTDSLNILMGMRMYYNMPESALEEDEGKWILKGEQGETLLALPKNTSRNFYHMGLELFLAYHNLSEKNVHIEKKELTVTDSEGKKVLRVPLVNEQLLEINWFSKWANPVLNPRCSIADLYRYEEEYYHGTPEQKTKADAFFEQMKDAIILVGATDLTLQDLTPTPFDAEPVPKVGVIGNVVKTLFSGKYLQNAPQWMNIFIILSLTAILSMLGLYTGKHRLLVITVIGISFISYILLTFFAFSYWDFVLPLIIPIDCAITTAFFGLVIRITQEEFQRNRVKNLFGTYLSPELVSRMVEQGEDPHIGGIEQNITAFFSDVQHFSEFSEKLTASQLVELMNEYLSAMTDIIQDEEGTLDKYIGDGIVAIFGAPLIFSDHAARACRAAARMQERQQALCKKWAKESKKWPASIGHMFTRIGINTGTAVVGNMGSHNRFNYTMMGDCVNLAARCESAAKMYGIYTLITQETKFEAERFSDELLFRKLDKILVLGRVKPVEVYQILGFKDELSPQVFECKDIYEKALHAYWLQDWNGALALLEKSSELEPLQPLKMAGISTDPSLVLSLRCYYFKQNPPDLSWNGTFVMDSK